MKKLLVLSLSFLGLTACGPAQKQGPWFWKAEKEGQTIYVLGTIHHSIALEDLQCKELIEDSVSQSDLVWTEIDINRKQELQQTLGNIVMKNPSGHSFKSLSEESQSFLQKKFEQVGGNPDELKQLSYSGLAFKIGVICGLEQAEALKGKLPAQASSNKFLDLDIQNLAQKAGIKITYLDNEDWFIDFTKETQTNASKEGVEEVIKNYNQDCQSDKLLKHIEFILKNKEELVEKYKKGIPFDVLKIHETELINQGLSTEEIQKSIDIIKNDLLKRRNEIWLEKLTSAEEKNMFVAGGLAHFKGSNNVLDGLKKEGFSIKRFNSECQAE